MSDSTKTRKPRSGFMRFFMGLIATLLCIALFFVIIVGSFILDLRMVTSAEGFEKILTQLFIPSASAAASDSSYALNLLSTSSKNEEQDLTTPITDLFYGLLQEAFGDEVPMTKESVNEFISKSTAPKMLAEKISGTIDDFIYETSNTTVTKAELMDLIRENVPLIEEHFELEVSEEALDGIESALDELPLMQEMEQRGLMPILEGYLVKDGNEEKLDSVRTILRAIRTITSDTSVMILAGVVAFLFALIWLVNWSFIKTLTDVGITTLVAGALLSIFSILLSYAFIPLPIPQLTLVLDFLQSVGSTFAFVHYSIAAAGALFIVLSIVFRMLRRR